MKELFVRELQVNNPEQMTGYYTSVPAVRAICDKPLVFTHRITFLVGENGAGKSTLIEALAIAMGFNPEGGTKNYTFATNETHADLYKYLRVAKGRHARCGYFLRAESFYNVATKEEEIAQGGGGLYIPKEYHHKSHGEAFLQAMQDFPDDGLYILDEPEAALSPTGLMRMLCIMHDLEGSSQFIISTHSPILMSYPGAGVYELDEEGIRETDYRDTVHYRLTRQFMDDPQRMYDVLFADKE